MSDVLELVGIEKSYHTGKPNQINVLSGADLKITRGEVVALVAPSGAGKSTLLHIAGLLDSANGGVVRIAGQDVAGLSERRRTGIRRAEVGFVYQFHHLLPEFSALENIVLPQFVNGTSQGAAEARGLALLESVGLAARAGHRPAELSGGEQQRVAFCRALANAPKLLLADEPTGNLDPETAEVVFEALMNLARDEGLSAVIATHNPELAARMDRIVRLENGRLV
ncbi:MULTISPECIES: ABC transporter ATP-binding protein [Falsihalocynthiibacter]|jgi:lipoprotein-releasing system ATP-binding protein|uniref:ABC transporter ATP-binding protein n=1 Tax=Falsihalocynthiibacter TaxID=2854182 RepID=UPI0030038F2E